MSIGTSPAYIEPICIYFSDGKSATHGSCLSFPLMPLKGFTFCNASESACLVVDFLFRFFKVLLVDFSSTSLRYSPADSLSLWLGTSRSISRFGSSEGVMDFDPNRAERRVMVASWTRPGDFDATECMRRDRGSLLPRSLHSRESASFYWPSNFISQILCIYHEH